MIRMLDTFKHGLRLPPRWILWIMQIGQIHWIVIFPPVGCLGQKCWLTNVIYYLKFVFVISYLRFVFTCKIRNSYGWNSWSVHKSDYHPVRRNCLLPRFVAGRRHL